jgi:hypothetical protein
MKAHAPLQPELQLQIKCAAVEVEKRDVPKKKSTQLSSHISQHWYHAALNGLIGKQGSCTLNKKVNDMK